jgi:hypothetical protein
VAPAFEAGGVHSFAAGKLTHVPCVPETDDVHCVPSAPLRSSSTAGAGSELAPDPPLPPAWKVKTTVSPMQVPLFEAKEMLPPLALTTVNSRIDPMRIAPMPVVVAPFGVAVNWPPESFVTSIVSVGAAPKLFGVRLKDPGPVQLTVTAVEAACAGAAVIRPTRPMQSTARIEIGFLNGFTHTPEKEILVDPQDARS